MKGNNTWIKHKLIAATMMLALLSSACIKRCDALDRFTEGYEARKAMKSTVKIYAKLTGKRKNILSSSEAPADGTEIKMGWTGSGVVIKNNHDKKQSLLMSVYHVTHPDPIMLRMDETGIYIVQVVKLELQIETLDGTMCSADTLAGNFKQDVSVLYSKCIAGEPAELAETTPPIGANVLISGAALGYHPKNIFIVTDGRYMGLDEESGEEIVTLPSAPGHSGSAVYYKGKIIGLLSKRTIAYEHISLCVSLENAKALLELGERIWLLKD